MDFASTRIHHITVCSAAAQPDIDFFTQIFGQRLIKPTILFDGRFAHYHLSYVHAKIDPATVMTGFPYSLEPIRVPQWHPPVTVGVRGTAPSRRIDATFLREEEEAFVK